MNLDRLFIPAAIAIVGASQDLTTISGQPVAHLKSHGHPGAIFPVNPKYEEIGGCKAYPGLKSLPQTPDLALILVNTAREYGIGVVGPNCQGMMNIGGNVYAGFGSPFKMESLRHGPVSMVSQSGGSGYPILTGARGKPPIDVDALAEAIVKLGALAIDLKEFVAEIDINPLFVFPSGGIKAGDALIKLAPPE